MTRELNLPDLAAELRGFYVPQFAVRIAGAGLPQDVLRDVVQVTYKDSLEELDSFEVTVNNWDDAARRFKYIGSETAEELAAGGDAGNRFQLFEPCAKVVTLHMGYLGHTARMLTGTFTTMTPSFSDGGPPTLSVRALNVLHQFRRKRKTRNFGDKNESEIAEEVGRDAGDGGDAFPMRICVNRGARANDERPPLTAQNNEYDIDFLWRLARRKGYVLVVHEAVAEEGRETQPGYLYFGPSARQAGCNGDDDDSEVPPPPSYRLDWGKSLIDFNPRLTTANQFKSVTVRGWDRNAQRAISETVDFTDRELRDLNCDLHRLIVQCDPREEMVVDQPVSSVREAKERARALLLDQHKQMVTATARTVGIPQLRAGVKVRIGGLGARLSGVYTVKGSEHRIDDSGYITKLELYREHVPDAQEPTCPSS
jgi:phage protein D